MKTKLEILESHIHPTKFMSSLSTKTGKTAILNAMDEHAKQIAMEFGKFIANIDTDHYFWCDIEKVWRITENDKVIKLTDAELFSKFEEERAAK